MNLPWLQKFTDARLLGDLATEYLAEQDIKNAIIQLRLAVQIYKQLIDKEQLTQAIKTRIEQKLNYESSRLRALNQLVRSRTRIEMVTRHSPVKESKIRRKQ